MSSAAEYDLDDPQHCVVWREGFRATFLLLPALEGAALAMARDGATFGALCTMLAGEMGAERGVAAAGTMLGGWINNGFVAGVSV